MVNSLFFFENVLEVEETLCSGYLIILFQSTKFPFDNFRFHFNCDLFYIHLNCCKSSLSSQANDCMEKKSKNSSSSFLFRLFSPDHKQINKFFLAIFPQLFNCFDLLFFLLIIQFLSLAVKKNK